MNHGHGLVCVLVSNNLSYFDKKIYLVPAVRMMPHRVDLSVIINHLKLWLISYLYERLFVIEIRNNNVKTIIIYNNIDHLTWYRDL